MPKLLKAIPSKLADQVKQDQAYGGLLRVVDIVFMLLRHLRPDSIEDKQAVLRTLTSPNPCQHPQAAHRELKRWQSALHRAGQLGCGVPGVDQLYAGARSIFSSVFTDTNDFNLKMRFSTH